MSKGPSLGSVLTGAFATVVVGGGLFLKSATDAASSFFAEFEGVNQIFGDAAPTVQRFADQAARLVGVSETAALQAAKGFGVFASAAGLGGNAAATFSVDLVKAAGDLASFNDVPVEETLAAIKSGLQGQGEPLSKYGILMNEASLRNKAFEEGIISTTDQALTPQERVLAANALILDELGVAQNDFVNYSDTYGNSVKTITATFTDLHTEIGLALMPAIENMVIGFSEAFSQIQDPTTDLGESWNELIGTFEAFGETIESVFGKIDLAGIMTGILDVVQLLVNGFSQLIYIGGDVGDILGRIFSGDFMGAGQQASTFFTRYNEFVDGLYDSADASALRAKIAADLEYQSWFKAAPAIEKSMAEKFGYRVGKMLQKARANSKIVKYMTNPRFLLALAALALAGYAISQLGDFEGQDTNPVNPVNPVKIGRASCRERV
jgi:hypothetical protein